ncbi:MAG TPA: long-chain fatty acid--CoA ligase [Actinocrinis sp.]|nr:long-chain fatty acid--CoA ligase [Actinocrinis sp.]
MRNQGLGSWTARRARKTPGAVAVVHEETRYTYAQLHERATRLAHHLRTLGIRRGDRVAFIAPNHPAFLEALFAAGQLGAVFVPLNTRLSPRELDHCVSDSGAGILIHSASCTSVAPGQVPTLRVTIPIDDDYERVVGGGPRPEPIDEPISLADTCLIMYTSGTTGRAKGAQLTHGNIIWNSINVLVDTDFAHDEVTLVTAPLFHTAALNMTCLPTLLKGGTVVVEAAFDPARTLELVERHRVTVMFGVPAMYQAVAADPAFATADLSSVRSLLCGGAPVPEPLIRTYLDRGLSFIQGYGATEASPGVLLLDGEHALSKAGTAGVPHFFTDVRVSALTGEPAEVGERGEIEVQGPNVMRGYWGDPESTAQSLRDGWLRTGDVAIVDGDGYVKVVDRVKDMIISGGENVYPAEVEEVFYSHHAVAECAVIGIPDERWGEVGRAIVVLREGVPRDETIAKELLDHLVGRLAKYKIPKSVVFTESLPRTGAGKVVKARLRETHGDA